MRNRIAVFMPVYDRPHLTRLGLECLARQKFTDFDVYIVNDGGPNDAQYRELVARYADLLHVSYIYIGPITCQYRADLALNMVLVRLGSPYERLIRFDDDVFPEPEAVGQHALFGDASVIVLGEIRPLALSNDKPITLEELTQKKSTIYMRDLRRIYGIEPHDFSIESCWSGHISYPVRELQRIGGADSQYVGVKINGDIDVAARLVHQTGCRVQYWERAITYHAGPPYQWDLLAMVLSKPEGYQYELLLSGRMDEYQRTYEKICNKIGFRFPGVDHSLQLPEDGFGDVDMDATPYVVPVWRSDDASLDVVQRLARQAYFRRKG